MKPANKIFYSIILVKLIAIGLVIVAAASFGKLNTQLNQDQDIAQTMPVSKQQIQTIVISTKRLSLEEKLMMDMEHARTMQANAQFNKMIRKTA